MIAERVEQFSQYLGRLWARWGPGAVDRASALLDRLQPLLARLGPAGRRGRDWLAQPHNSQRAGLVLVSLLVLLGLNIPPISLFTRLRTLSYASLDAGRDASVTVNNSSASLDFSRHSVLRGTRVRLDEMASIPSEAGPLPTGYQAFGAVYGMEVVGPVPKAAILSIPLKVTEVDHPFVDPLGWDGKEWRWLSSRFIAANRLYVEIPMERFVPKWVVVARATQSSTQVAAVLLPPPAAPPAAVAQLPILEMAAYYLDKDDGSVAGRPFPIPNRKAKLYGVIGNRQGNRLRNDLINNVLIRPESRLKHRQSIVQILKRDKLRGVVLDYRGIDTDLQIVYGEWLKRLADDLHAQDGELIVAVPMPTALDNGKDWNDAPYNWRNLATRVDGLRILLPGDRPLEIGDLDSMLRWALKKVDRRRLQLAVPVQGRDIVDQETALIGFGPAFAHVLDMASSDAPARMTPGESGHVALPTLRLAELGRDPATGMWRFYYWDANRRQHTVWLNDATGLQPAFEMAAKYRLARLALDGVEAGLDPALWRLVQLFISSGKTDVSANGEYLIQWQLVDSLGQVVQDSFQPLAAAALDVKAPQQQGNYYLGVNLVTADKQLAAVGKPTTLQIAPPPPPTAVPTPLIIIIENTPEIVVTAPSPLDEQRINRAPIRVSTAESEGAVGVYDGMIAFAEVALRDAPDAAATLISDLRVGERFVLVEPSDSYKNWLHIRLTGTGVEGFVLAQLVALGTPTPTPIAATAVAGSTSPAGGSSGAGGGTAIPTTASSGPRATPTATPRAGATPGTVAPNPRQTSVTPSAAATRGAP